MLEPNDPTTKWRLRERSMFAGVLISCFAAGLYLELAGPIDATPWVFVGGSFIGIGIASSIVHAVLLLNEGRGSYDESLTEWNHD